MDIDNDYFMSYGDLETHRLMLEDEPRTMAYKKAILGNKTYFKDKIIMDVGCGTGILSIFCAQAGAKKVYAIEASKIANIAKEIVRENNYEEIIEVIETKVEDLVLPDNVKVDAIVSEWMGFYLLHEGMLDSVIVARDKFLKEGGEIFPESAAIYVAPCSIPSLYSKWDNVYGVSMKSFARHLQSNKSNKPEILSLKEDDLIAEEVAMAWINLREDEVTDLNSYTIQHVVGAKKSAKYQGLCVWFECKFPDLSEDRQESCVILDTSPMNAPTHWKQTVIVLPHDLEVEAGEPIAFQLDMERDVSNCRRYNIKVELLDPEVIEHPLPCSCDLTKCIIIKTFMLQHPNKLSENENTEDILEDCIEDVE